jgi:hypothetical protein
MTCASKGCSSSGLPAVLMKREMASCTGCSLNPFRTGIGMAIGNIVGDSVIEEKGILINNRDQLAQAFERQITKINSIKGNGT